MKLLTILFIVLFVLFTLFIESKQQTHYQTTQQQTEKSTSLPSDMGQSNGSGSCHAIHTNATDPQAYLPDPTCTPGVTNPAVTQDTLATTICVSGFTKTIRPVASYTDHLKLQQIQQYGYTDTNPRDYEEDHFISLELGGSPADPKNLWPEPHPSTNEKDKVENYLHKQICNGTITLVQAQKEITQNWYTVYQQIQ